MDQKELIELQAKYKLTEEEYQQYYHAVNMFFTAGKQSEEKPKLVFVAGQAGAGKSRLIPVVNKKLNYNAVVIDYDVIRSMHPKFESYTSTFFRYAMQLESDANPRWYLKVFMILHMIISLLHCKDSRVKDYSSMQLYIKEGNEIQSLFTVFHKCQMKFKLVCLCLIL